MDALDRRSALPLWAQLRDRLAVRVESGEFAGRFPTEPELMAEYGVSRHTVREALQTLRAQGRVVAERGRGSRVVAVSREPDGALWSLFRAVESAGMTQTSDVLTLTEVTAPTIAVQLELPPGEPLVHLERLRRVDGEPLAHDRAWLPARLARPLLDADFTHTALYDQLTQRCGVTLDSVRETVTATTGTEAERERLALADTPDVALLVLQRKGYSAGRPVEWRETRVRADRFRLDIGWAPPPAGTEAGTGGLHLAGALTRRRSA